MPSTAFETCLYEVDREPYFYSEDDENEYYTNLAVVVEDLKREFAGYESEQDHLIYQRVRPDLDAKPARSDTDGQRREQFRSVGRTRQRGRRPQYEWQLFAAEMVRRVIGAPPTSQADFEREMLEWCSETWGKEPSESQVREWVAPAFKALRGAHHDVSSLQDEARSDRRRTDTKSADRPNAFGEEGRERTAEIRDALFRSGLGTHRDVTR
jgi:hypothetical protein